MPQARTPEWVRNTSQYAQAKEAREAAEHAAQRATEVTDEASCARAAEILVQAKGAAKAIDKGRLDAGAPYRASTEAINAEFKELAAPVSGIVERLTEEVGNFEQKVRDEEAAAQRKHEEAVRAQEKAQRDAEEKAKREAAEAAKRNEPPPPPPTPAPPPPPPPPPPQRSSAVRHTSGGSVGSRTEWKHEIVDPALVPAKYKLIDEVQLGKDVRAGAREIPGVRIYPVQNVQARTRKA
jgi:hypothetical protein